MSNRVFMCSNTGEVLVGKPIFFEHEQPIEQVGSYTIFMSVKASEHIGYALFHKDECLALYSNDLIKRLPMEDIGEL